MPTRYRSSGGRGKSKIGPNYPYIARHLPEHRRREHQRIEPLELGEEFAEIGDSFAERHVLGVCASTRTVAHEHVEQPVLYARDAIAMWK